MKTPSLAVIGLVAMTCACASGPQGGPPGPDGDFGPPPMGPRVFVSPFGEPFDATPGQTGVAVWFGGADGDGDGRLTPAEFDADGVRWFMVLDADRDGRIGPGEVAAYEAMIGARLGGMRGAPGGIGPGSRPRPGRPGGGPMGGAALNDQIGGQDMPGGGPGGGSRMGGPRPGATGPYRPPATPLAMANLLNVPQPVKAADLDVNQFITSEEWQRTSARWFGLLDRDKNGVLTLAELPALRSGAPGAARGGQPGGGPRPPG
ncbi:MAG: hypothetical protein ACT6RD_00800 [Brevundimonas sp.]|uniref:hypothetical protein n=1 Tax=Brevundimonas sp. TaxID=1871086 RepID=UPI004033BE10